METIILYKYKITDADGKVSFFVKAEKAAEPGTSIFKHFTCNRDCEWDVVSSDVVSFETTIFND